MISFILVILSLLISVVGLLLIKRFLRGTKLNLSCPMDGKTIILTSCNEGLGKEMALDLLSNGAKVIFAGIDQENHNKIINSISDEKIKNNASYIRVDFGSFTSIRTFVDTFHSQFNDFDIFINNTSEYYSRFGLSEGIENTFMYNHIGPMFMMLLLSKHIKPQGRFINITSKSFTYLKQEDIDKYFSDKNFEYLRNNYKKATALAVSKLAFLAFCLHLDLFFQASSTDVKVVSLDPGYVLDDPSSTAKTLLSKGLYYIIMPFIYLFVKSPKTASRSPLNLAYMDYSNLSSSGYYNEDKLVSISTLARNQENRKKIVNFSYELIRERSKEDPAELIKFFNF